MIQKKVKAISPALGRRVNNIINAKQALFIVVVVFIIYALSKFNLRELIDSLKQIPVWIIILIAGMQVGAQILLNLEWYAVSRVPGVKISFADMFYINSQGYIVESVTPGVKLGGEVTRAVQINKFGGCGVSAAASVVALQKLFSIGVFVAVTLLAVSYMITKAVFFDSFPTKLAVYCALALFLAVIIIIFAFPHKLKKLFGAGAAEGKKIGRIKKFLINMFDMIISIRSRPSAWITILVLALADWLIYPFKVIILAKQITPDVDMLFITGAVFVAYMVAMLPLFPGGLGGFEGTMVGLLIIGGFAPSDALAISIVFRFISFWFVILFSAAFVGVYRLFLVKKRKIARTGE